jgi:hypothetical protein
MGFDEILREAPPKIFRKAGLPSPFLVFDIGQPYDEET